MAIPAIHADNVEQLEELLLALPADSRASLADRLIESLDSGADADADAEEA